MRSIVPDGRDRALQSTEAKLNERADRIHRRWRRRWRRRGILARWIIKRRLRRRLRRQQEHFAPWAGLYLAGSFAPDPHS